MARPENRRAHAIVVVGLEPPGGLTPMVLAVRRVAEAIGPAAQRAVVSLRTDCPVELLPERAEAARAQLRRRQAPLRSFAALNPRVPGDLELFVQWAPWSRNAVLRGSRRRDHLLSVSGSGRAAWAMLSVPEVEATDRWLRARAVGRLVDMDDWTAKSAKPGAAERRQA